LDTAEGTDHQGGCNPPGSVRFSAVRRLLFLVVAAPTFAPAGHAVILQVGGSAFSPALSTLAIHAAPQSGGVELTTPGGRRIGWISHPGAPRPDSIEWDGRLEGRPVPDGRYLVRLRIGDRTIASSPLTIDRQAPRLEYLRVGNGNHPFAGDSPMLTTVTPNGDGVRDSAIVRFRLAESATVTLEVTRTVTSPRTIFTVTKELSAGSQSLTWTPPLNLRPRTYLLRLTVVDAAGNDRLYGAETAFVSRYLRAPVVRVRGIDAGFLRPNYAPGQVGALRIATDASELTLQVFKAGPEELVTYADDQLHGVAVGGPESICWSAQS